MASIEMETIKLRIAPDGRLTADDAAIYLGLSPKTLANRRSFGQPPQCWTKYGGRVFYFKDGLDEFIRSHANEAQVA